jgi:hypothetical protein
MSAYGGNLDVAVENVIDADPVGAAVRAMMATRTEWTGTAAKLLGVLSEVVGERAANAKNWPGSPRALSGWLTRAATFLRKVGIEVRHDREMTGKGNAPSPSPSPDQIIGGHNRPNRPNRPKPHRTLAISRA